jgi:hypothetical protein
MKIMGLRFRCGDGDWLDVGSLDGNEYGPDSAGHRPLGETLHD